MTFEFVSDRYTVKIRNVLMAPAAIIFLYILTSAGMAMYRRSPEGLFLGLGLIAVLFSFLYGIYLIQDSL